MDRYLSIHPSIYSGGAVGRTADAGVMEALLATQKSHRDQRCVLGNMCRQHLAEYAAASALCEDLQRLDSGEQKENNYPKVPLSSQRCDDILHAILVADNASCNGPVVPLAHGQYAVIRCEPDTFECNYASPAGVSIVTLRLHKANAEGPMELELPCTCSVFQKGKSTCGGKSLMGGAKTCLCGLMVIFARLLQSPLDEIKRSAAAHLHAVIQHQRDEAVPKPRHNICKQVVHDAAVARLLMCNDRFDESVESGPCGYYQAMSAATKSLELHVACGGDPLQAPVAHPYFPNTLAPLDGPSGQPECDGCSVGGSRMAGLRRLPQDARGDMNRAWVYVGEVVKRCVVSLYACHQPEHKCADGSRMRIFGPDGVCWSKSTGLFGVCRKWFFSLLLLFKLNELIFIRKMIPSRAFAHVIHCAHAYMSLHISSPNLPSFGTALEKLGDAWYMFIELQAKPVVA